MKTTRILFVIAMVLAIAAPAEAKKVKLQYKLKAGDQFKYEVRTQQDNVQEIMGQTNSTTSTSQSSYGFNVKEVTASGDMVLSVALIEYGLSAVNPGGEGEMKFNSLTDTIVPNYAKSMVALLNEYYSFTLSPFGKISNVIAPEGIVEKVNKVVESLGDQMKMGAQAVGATASAEGFQKTLEGLIISFPEAGAETKKPWELESETNQMVAFKVVSKFEFINSSKDANEIKMTAQVTQKPGTPPMEIQGMNMTFEMVGAKEGSLLLDPLTNLIKTGTYSTSISGTISIDGPQLPSPMSIPMTSLTKETITRK